MTSPRARATPSTAVAVIMPSAPAVTRRTSAKTRVPSRSVVSTRSRCWASTARIVTSPVDVFVPPSDGEVTAVAAATPTTRMPIMVTTRHRNRRMNEGDAAVRDSAAGTRRSTRSSSSDRLASADGGGVGVVIGITHRFPAGHRHRRLPGTRRWHRRWPDLRGRNCRRR